jgi:hypothetical protein
MPTEIFITRDQEYLKSILTPKNLAKIWRQKVRRQVRNLGIKDIFDNYDFNYNIERNSKLIRDIVINGEYQTTRPLIYALEKKFGISRHMVVPAPSDALLLQTLADDVRSDILRKQPSANSYFSRDNSNVTRDWSYSDYGGNWLTQWTRMQKQIYKFSKVCDFLVVTDISDFYDNIDLSLLRRNLSRLINGKEVQINLILRIIDGLSWKPDYLPNSNRGLPTILMEAVRLLAHSTLFEVDRVLDSLTNGNFVRWMDDITFGVKTFEDGKLFLSKISDVLKSKSLSLNISKTNILSSADARKEHMFDENKEVDNLKRKLANGISKQKLEKDIEALFQFVVSNKERKNWDKVAKRLIGLFSRLHSEKFLPYLEEYYLKYPTLRDSISTYLRVLGYNKKTSETVLKIIKSMKLIDDVSLFQIINIITDWEIRIGKRSSLFLSEIDKFLNDNFRLRRSPFDFYCYIWLKAKYSKPKVLMDFIENYSYIWTMHPFLRRQIVAVLPRLFPYFKKKIRDLLNQQLSSGDVNVISIALQIEEFTRVKKLDNKLKYYIFPDKNPEIYPLSKFLVLCSILNSKDLKQKDYLKQEINQKVTDPYYSRWLRKYF